MNSIYISCYGSGIYTALGLLERLNRHIENITIWNVTSCGSLILFMKCLGFTYKQSKLLLEDKNELFNYFHYSSLSINNRKENLGNIELFLKDILNLNDIFYENITLEDVYKLTNIFCCFIVFDKKSKTIINLNPLEYGNYSFLKCVLSSLTFVGIYEDYIYKDHIFSNVLAIEPYPENYFYKKYKNISIIQKDLCHLEKTFFSNIIYILIEEFNNRLNIALKDKDMSNIVLITGFILPVYNEITKLFLFNHGSYLGGKFLENKISHFTWEKNIN